MRLPSVQSPSNAIAASHSVSVRFRCCFAVIHRVMMYGIRPYGIQFTAGRVAKLRIKCSPSGGRIELIGSEIKARMWFYITGVRRFQSIVPFNIILFSSGNCTKDKVWQTTTSNASTFNLKGKKSGISTSFEILISNRNKFAPHCIPQNTHDLWIIPKTHIR